VIANFSQELYKKLLQKGFNTIRGFYENNVLDNDTKFFGLLKEEGASWYAVIIINMEKFTLSEFKEKNADYTNFFETIQQKYATRNIFITNIMLNEKSSDEVNDFIENLEEFLHQPTNNIYWGMNMEDGNIIQNKHHPTEILNLKATLKNVYSQVEPKINYHNYGKNFDTLRELAQNESTHKQKLKEPYIMYAIMIMNLTALLMMESNGGSTNVENLILFGAIEPYRILYQGEYHRLFTAMFLHVGFAHFIHNSLSLYIFGSRVEKYYGRINFAIIYVLGGLMGSAFSLFFTRGISAGASGAIFSLIGATTIMTKVRGQDLEGLGFYNMLMYILVSVGFGFVTPNVDNFGHLGGFIGGIVIGHIICRVSEKSGG